MLVQSAKDWGSLPSNIKQATSQAASDAVDSRLSASTSQSWTEGGLRELNSPGHIGTAPPSMHLGSIAGTPPSPELTIRYFSCPLTCTVLMA